MLVLSRKENEVVTIGGDVTVRVVKIKGSRVQLGIEAPHAVKVIRGELTPLPGIDDQAVNADWLDELLGPWAAVIGTCRFRWRAVVESQERGAKSREFVIDWDVGACWLRISVGFNAHLVETIWRDRPSRSGVLHVLRSLGIGQRESGVGDQESGGEEDRDG